MSIANTAKLLASLDLQDNMTPKLRTAIGGVAAAEGRIGSLSGKVSAFAANLSGGASQALGTFTGRIKGLATAGAGLLGIGGLFGIGALFKAGIDEARDFGAEVVRLAKLTGLAVPVTSALASAFHHFGIDAETAAKVVGMAEKNLGVLAKTTKSAQKYQDQFGLSLLDANGKVLTFNDLLLRSADYFNNKSIPAQTKALALQKLYGRSWQDLIPILSAGRKGIADAEEEAKRLGLTLTQDNIDALIKSRDATRNWSTALAGLQLQLGLSFLPTLTEVTKGLTEFVSGHRADIVAFFRNALATAKTAASAIGDFAGALIGAWDSIPAGLRDLMLKAFVTDRAVKFLFGFSPISVALKAGEGLLAGLAGAVGKSLGASLVGAGLGKLFVQPVFVVGATPGLFGGLGNLAGGAAGAAEGAAGGLSLGAIALGLTAVAAFGVAVGLATKKLDELLGVTPGNLRDPNDPRQQHGTPITVTVTPFHDSAELHAAEVTKQALIDFRAGERADWTASVEATRALTGAMTKANWLKKLEDSWRRAGQTMHDKIKEAVAALGGPHGAIAAAFLGSHVGQAGFGAGGLKQAEQIIAELKALHSDDPHVIAAINRITAQLPRLKVDVKDLTAAEKIAQSSDPKNVKLDKLNKLLADLKAHGDPTAHKKLEGIITAVRNKKLHTTVNTKTFVETSLRTFIQTAAIVDRYAIASVVQSHKNVGGTIQLAAGGPYRAGQPRIVGERGPELEVPSSSGYILDATKTAALLAAMSRTTTSSGSGSSGLATALGHVTNPTARAALEGNLLKQIVAELRVLHADDVRLISAVHRITAELPRLKVEVKGPAAERLGAIMADLRSHGLRGQEKRSSEAKTHLAVTNNINIRIPVNAAEAGNTVRRVVGRSGATLATT